MEHNIKNEIIETVLANNDDDDYEEITIEPQFLLQLIGITPGKIIHRPSLQNNSGAIADVLLLPTQTIIHCYSPALGCGGLAEQNTEVYVTECNPYKKHKGHQSKCTHNLFLAVYNEGDLEEVIGVYPKIAIELVESAIEKNFLHLLQNVKQLKRDVPMVLKDKVNSKFDFCGICEDDVPFLMKVMNVTFADYSQINPTRGGKRGYESKTAFYPENGGTVDADLLKVIRDLTTIKNESIIRGVLCFVIQRTDVELFNPFAHDTVYTEVVKDALAAGVIIITIVVSWTRDGKAYFLRDDLPVHKN